MVSRNSRLTIGLLIDGLYGMGSYQNEVWKGVLKGAELEDVNLICFSGGTIKHSPNNPFEKYRNIIYSYINKNLIDGIVFTGLTLGNYVSPEEYMQFCKNIEPLPMVSIGGPIFNYSSINIDNKSGLYEIIKHLITVHNAKKIAFIKGAEGNKDAIERFEVYKKVLSEFNLPYDDNLVYKGNFMEQSGADCIKELLDVRKIKFDAVVASNDNMALGALSELKKRGFIIPDEVAVTGFDDIQDASAVYPALTTIKQPIIKQGEEAVHALVKKIKNIPLDEITLPTEPIYRKSCGCQMQDIDKAFAKSEIIINNLDHIENEKDNLSKEILNVINKYSSQEYKNLIGNLIDSLSDDIKDNSNNNKFLYSLDRIIQALLRDGIFVSKFQIVLSIIRNSFYSYVYNNSINCQKFENIFQQARVLVSEMTMYSMTNEKIVAEKESFTLDQLSMSLSSTFDKNELIKIIADQFDKLEINVFFISLYTKNDLSEANLIMAYQNNKTLEIKKDQELYNPMDLLPANFNTNRRFKIIVYPLYFKDQHIGILLVDGKTTKGLVYESIFIKLSSAFQASKIFQKNIENQEMLKNKNFQIQSLVYPMIESINNVVKIASDKITAINDLKNISKSSWQKIIETAKSIEKTSKDMTKMLELIKVIDDISANINIVALNASIEAAHVGVSGKGFAIIAGEIRKLSELTKKHAGEIKNTISIINSSINNSVSTVFQTQQSFNDLEKGINGLIESLQIINNLMKLLDESSKSLLDVMDNKK
jgi:DNA-binding LacI/PurR family transcriptional regulator